MESPTSHVYNFLIIMFDSDYDWEGGQPKGIHGNLGFAVQSLLKRHTKHPCQFFFGNETLRLCESKTPISCEFCCKIIEDVCKHGYPQSSFKLITIRTSQIHM